MDMLPMSGDVPESSFETASAAPEAEPTQASVPPNQPPNQRGTGKRRKKNGNWTTEALKSAIAAVEGGEKLRTAARFFGIPATSLSDHVYGRTLTRKRGPNTILSEREEQALKSFMIQMQELGHPLSMHDLRHKVALITQERVTPFRNGIPGDSWLRWFKSRHPDLTIRRS